MELSLNPYYLYDGGISGKVKDWLIENEDDLLDIYLSIKGRCESRALPIMDKTNRAMFSDFLTLIARMSSVTGSECDPRPTYKPHVFGDFNVIDSSLFRYDVDSETDCDRGAAIPVEDSLVVGETADAVVSVKSTSLR